MLAGVVVLGLCTRVPPHAVFSRHETRTLLYRWRPLEREENVARLVRYTRALDVLTRDDRAFGIVGGYEEEALHLYVLHRKTPSVHVLDEILWSPDAGTLERVQAVRALRHWHAATFPLVTLTPEKK